MIRFPAGGSAPPLAESPLLHPDFLVASGLLACALLMGALAIHAIDRYKKRLLLADRRPTADLAGFRKMFERGELTEGEYERVRQRAAQRMKRDIGAAPTRASERPSAPAPEATPAPPPPPE